MRVTIDAKLLEELLEAASECDYDDLAGRVFEGSPEYAEWHAAETRRKEEEREKAQQRIERLLRAANNENVYVRYGEHLWQTVRVTSGYNENLVRATPYVEGRLQYAMAAMLQPERIYLKPPEGYVEIRKGFWAGYWAPPGSKYDNVDLTVGCEQAQSMRAWSREHADDLLCSEPAEICNRVHDAPCN